MALPALQRAAPGVVVVRSHLAPLLALARLPGRVLALDPGLAGLARAAAELRGGLHRRGVLLTPSLSSALLFRLAGLAERRGTNTDHRGLLLTEAVSPAALAGLHRTAAYLALATGQAPAEVPRPRLEVPEAVRAAWRALSPAPPEQAVGIFPGSNAPARRWPVRRFADLAAALRRRGLPVVVFGGPGETELTRLVADGGGVDVGGLTDLPLLAAGLADCRLLVTNDSGPLHLAAAVGTPTVSFWGPGNPRETGPTGPGHRLLRHAELPCVPCVKNHCPRRGKGTILDHAQGECLGLITVDDAERAVLGALEG